MNGFTLDDFLPYQLAVVAQRTSRGFAARYQQKFGISIPEWRVVAHLSQAGSVSIREIYDRVDMDKSKVSRAATKLELAGYVTKRIDPDDRRLIALSLTDKGRAMIDEIAPMAEAYEREVLAGLGPDAEHFRALMARLMDQIRPV